MVPKVSQFLNTILLNTHISIAAAPVWFAPAIQNAVTAALTAALNNPANIINVSFAEIRNRLISMNRMTIKVSYGCIPYVHC
jgi:hypothetical protein